MSDVIVPETLEDLVLALTDVIDHVERDVRGQGGNLGELIVPISKILNLGGLEDVGKDVEAFFILFHNVMVVLQGLNDLADRDVLSIDPQALFFLAGWVAGKRSEELSRLFPLILQYKKKMDLLKKEAAMRVQEPISKPNPIV